MIKKSLLSTLGTVKLLLKTVLPISFLIVVLKWYGVIDLIGRILTPMMGLIGLPGESGIVIVSGWFSFMAGFAAMTAVDLSIRHITVMGVMISIAHNIFVESAITHKSGTNFWKIAGLRVVISIIAGICINLIFPYIPLEIPGTAVQTSVSTRLLDTIISWLISTLEIWIRVIGVVFILTLFIEFMREKGWIEIIAKLCSPLMKVMGISKKATISWVTAQFLGLTMGAALLIKQVKEDNLPKKDLRKLNVSIALNHSPFESAAILMALGIHPLFIIVPKYIVSIVIVRIMDFFYR